MVLRIQKKTNNRVFEGYLLAMFILMVVRYIFKVNVPAVAFLAVAMLPICYGSTSEQLAFVASCIPISIAFQYKYASLILSIIILIRNRWRLRDGRAFILVLAMMFWELCHAMYGYFSYVEYLRDFAELILLSIVMSLDLDEVDYKLILRSLSISVAGVCVIMLIMQMQQFGFNLIAVFARSARSFRFGQSNMESGAFAINFNANNLGFICNLSTCGMLLLATRREHSHSDVILAVSTVIFALMTMSRAAIICAVMIFVVFLFSTEGKLYKKMLGGVSGLLIALLAVVLIQIFVPSIFENILERFQRKDGWNGRDNLFQYYGQFLMSSPIYLLFGIGMQQIFEKVSPHFPVIDVPHMGMQEVWVAWGVVGVVMILIVLSKIITTSKRYARGKRQFYQFMPLILTLVYTSSGQFLTSSRALMALVIAYSCLCIKAN